MMVCKPINARAIPLVDTDNHSFDSGSLGAIGRNLPTEFAQEQDTTGSDRGDRHLDCRCGKPHNQG